MKLFLLLFTVLFMYVSPAHQKDDKVVFETVHDFGDFKIDDGPQTYTFVFTNNGINP